MNYLCVMLKLGLCLQNEDEAGVTTEEQVRIATAIYPTVSLMNHSCDASISARQVVMKSEHLVACYSVYMYTYKPLEFWGNYETGRFCSFERDRLVVRAIRSHKPGNEILNSYGQFTFYLHDTPAKCIKSLYV